MLTHVSACACTHQHGGGRVPAGAPPRHSIALRYFGARAFVSYRSYDSPKARGSRKKRRKEGALFPTKHFVEVTGKRTKESFYTAEVLKWLLFMS